MALESKLQPPKNTESTEIKPERPKTAKQEEKSDSDCFWDKLKTEITNNMYVGDVDFRNDFDLLGFIIFNHMIWLSHDCKMPSGAILETTLIDSISGTSTCTLSFSPTCQF